MITVLVTGDRHWTDDVMVQRTLDALLEQYGGIHVIEGHCPTGADRFAFQWVMDRARHAGVGVPVGVSSYPAHWRLISEKTGKPYYRPQAGPERNQQMVDFVQKLMQLGEETFVAGFHDAIEFSKGTADCLERARQAGLETVLFTHHGEERT